MARFQGNVHAGSERLAATLLFLFLIIVVGLFIWDYNDPVGFTIFWNNIAEIINLRR